MAGAVLEQCCAYAVANANATNPDADARPLRSAAHQWWRPGTDPQAAITLWTGCKFAFASILFPVDNLVSSAVPDVIHKSFSEALEPR